MADLIGWIANIFFVIGVLLIAKKKIHGFWVNCIGNLGYAIQGYLLDTWSLFWLSLLLIIINIYGIIEWRKQNG